MFLISSSRFRRATRNQVLFCCNTNQVNVTGHHPIGTGILANKTHS